MDYLYERRRRRRYRSPLSFSRDDDDIEHEIIERYEENKFLNIKNKNLFPRAIKIERNRERSLRRQFEYIVYNVKVSYFYLNK